MKKSKRIALSVLAFMVLALFVLNTVFIPVAIRKKLNGLHIGALSVKVEKIHAGFFNQSLKLSGILVSDSTGNFTAHVRQISCSGINIASLILHNRFKAHSLHIKSPEISISNAFQQDTTAHSEKKSSRQLKVLIKKVDIENSSFAYWDVNGDNDSILFARLNIHVDRFQLVPEKARHSYGQFGIDDLKLQVSDLKYLTDDDVYRIEVENIGFSTAEMALNTLGLRVIPLKERYEVGNRRGIQTDWFNINLRKINLEGLNPEKLIENHELWLTKLELDSLQMEAFRDVRLPMGPKPDTKLPGDMIAGIPIPLHCDSFILHHANIRYTERAVESTEAGHVDFTGLQAMSRNFTNIDSLLEAPVHMDVKAKLFDQAMMSAQLTFASSKFPHTYRMKGELEPMPFTAFNSMLQPALSARIHDGIIHRLAFDFTYDNDVSNGSLLLDYDNVKIEVLKRENQKDRKIQSALVNVLVHEHNHPDDKKYRQGTIGFERDKKKSVFNFWWKSILSGIKSVMV